MTALHCTSSQYVSCWMAQRWMAQPSEAGLSRAVLACPRPAPALTPATQADQGPRSQNTYQTHGFALRQHLLSLGCSHVYEHAAWLNTCGVLLLQLPPQVMQPGC